MAKMDNRQLATICEQEEEASVNFYTSDIAQEQETALDYYKGALFGDEVEGRSQVVSQDVAELVDTQVADMLEMLAADPDIVKITPTLPQNQPICDQAKAYVNNVFWQQNNGFMVLHDFVKDGFIQKVGVVKIYWEDAVSAREDVYENVPLPFIIAMEEDPDIEIVEADMKEVDNVELSPFFPDGVAYDVRVRITRERGRVRVANVAVEDFLVNVRAKNDVNQGFGSARYLAHRRTDTTATELLEMGFSKEVVEGLPADADTGTVDGRREHRYIDENYNSVTNNRSDDAMEQYTLMEEYIMVDFDGDGIAEKRQIFRVGHEILSNEIVDDHPFATFCPYPMPHKLYGQSTFDKAHSMQRIRSVLWRGMLDSQYLANNPRFAVDTAGGKVNLDDMLTSRPGGVVRTQGPPDRLIMPMAVANQAGDSLQLLQLADQEKARRTGVSMLDPALDKKAFLHDTATGQDKIMTKQQGRQRLIARIGGESLERIYRLIIGMAIEYQDVETMLQVHGEWTPVNPSAWEDEFIVNVQVGVGHMDKQLQLANLTNLLQIATGLASQGASFVQEDHLRNVYIEMIKTSGFKNVDDFVGDVIPPDPNPEPDPMMELQVAALETQQQDVNNRAAAKQAELQLEAKRHEDKIKIDAANTMIKAEKLKSDAQIKKAEFGRDIAFRTEGTGVPN
jgi:hypothetical protein